ncbi:hypothetical protein ESB04_00105 [Aquirufa rosea]|uniref:Uncharacterized protein n=1 Tax=Aquirufa rosea TaxID=2509241 RepID=A0A4Q1C1M2_9BACT|nr:hypothetical protein ESB04_00105 [Aquirufa rosea]
MDFETYLISKKIDELAFKTNDIDLYSTWLYEFNQLHEVSFTDQKRFQINRIRRKYPLNSTINS